MSRSEKQYDLNIVMLMYYMGCFFGAALILFLLLIFGVIQ